ncbi:MAG: inositol monophosphatase family protein [Cyanobacteria bacterium SBC]|nr:inositol monophosphatase family protein [Cyanobacteria bacterium SBC]
MTPRLILETLLPYVKVAGAYARQIQSRIGVRPDKDYPDNSFAAALSDADLSIQAFIEVALLGTFPQIRFYGEEYEHSANTKYFRAIDLGEPGDYLVTLDPIDGTKFYLDGHSNYQIILTVLDRDEFEAVLTLSPSENAYYYALRGQGAFRGTLDDSLDTCGRLHVTPMEPKVYLGLGLSHLVPRLNDRYSVVDLTTSYSPEVRIPGFSGMLAGELTGAIIESGKFIDGAALAFVAQEAGCIVTTWDGSVPPPLHACENYERPGLVIASSPTVHQHLLEAMQATVLS